MGEAITVGDGEGEREKLQFGEVQWDREDTQVLDDDV